jgi:hypothetical protein
VLRRRLVRSPSELTRLGATTNRARSRKVRLVSISKVRPAEREEMHSMRTGSPCGGQPPPERCGYSAAVSTHAVAICTGCLPTPRIPMTRHSDTHRPRPDRCCILFGACCHPLPPTSSWRRRMPVCMRLQARGLQLLSLTTKCSSKKAPPKGQGNSTGLCLN